ncbi:DUF4198 domain-containing protein [Undibacterium sp. TJN19]|uniref:DUF4198 domain-containing protein n=1 Tax=Undibacterium sp. TJN19 TaxID=3413055 RepID=UPI003BF225F6
MKTFKKIALFSVLACATFTAQAHRAFLVPSSTVVAGNTPWVTVDAAAATDVFVFDHMPLKLDNLFITAPDGTALKPENTSTGKFRSSFDVKLSQTGSYKMGILNEGLFASYKEDGKVKRWRGTAETFAKEVPANAEELQVTQRSGRIETFVTNGKPGGKAMDITGSGLELSGITHPNDLVAGETAQFRLTLDGKPAAKVSVTLIPGGIRYRQKLDEKTVVTDNEGKFSVTWANAGLYWLEAEIKDDTKAKAPAKSRVASYVATLEVLPQ